MLNWIACNRTVLTFKLPTYTKLNYLKKELFICIKMDLALNNLQRLICHKPKQINTQNYTYKYICRYTHVHTMSYISWPTIVEANPKADFSIATTLRYRGEHYSFPWIAPFTLDMYLIKLSGYHFFWVFGMTL